ncbi:MAG: hypothetical protein AB9836_11695 [Aminipila sp.]
MNNFKLLLILIITIFLLSSCSNDDAEAKQLTDENSHATATSITQKTKDYILNGQEDKPEADKIKWSETFLNEVNIDDLYQEYLSTGGTKDDIQSFALYLTENAPILDNWQDLVETDLFNAYDKKISHIEHLEDDLYQVYVNIDGSEIPYVVVNARTGYFHG